MGSVNSSSKILLSVISVSAIFKLILALDTCSLPETLLNIFQVSLILFGALLTLFEF